MHFLTLQGPLATGLQGGKRVELVLPMAFCPASLRVPCVAFIAVDRISCVPKDLIATMTNPKDSGVALATFPCLRGTHLG